MRHLKTQKYERNLKPECSLSVSRADDSIRRDSMNDSIATDDLSRDCEEPLKIPLQSIN